MAKKQGKKTENPVEQELNAIKRLLILLLIKAKTSNTEIAKALKIDKSDLSRMMPRKAFKPFE